MIQFHIKNVAVVLYSKILSYLRVCKYVMYTAHDEKKTTKNNVFTIVFGLF